MKQPFQSARRFALLAPQERRLIVQSFLLLPALSVALHMLELNRLLRLVQRRPLRTGGSARAPSASRSGELVNLAAARLPWTSTCLARSLMLQWLLRGHGVDAQLRIGARKADGELEAHCWLELQGEPVNDSAEAVARFEAFPRPISAVTARPD